MEQVTWYVGIDWGSESHAVCVVDAAGHRREERSVDHTADAVQACLDWIMTFTGATPAQIVVAIETPRGALVDACLARGCLVFAVNPKQLDRFRDRHTVAGAKDDRRDAWVLADSLRTDLAAFQQVHTEDPIVVQLRELSRAEEDLDADFRRLANQLRSQVHRLVPKVLALCPGADERWFWALLQLAPTPAAQRRLTRARVDHLLRAHRIRRWRGAEVVARLQASLFPHAPGVVEAVEAQIRLILPRLEVVHAQRLACGRQLEQLLQQLRDRPREADQRGEHRDIAILESLPGVGRKVAVTMLAEAAETTGDGPAKPPSLFKSGRRLQNSLEDHQFRPTRDAHRARIAFPNVPRNASHPNRAIYK
jgi:transposase